MITIDAIWDISKIIDSQRFLGRIEGTMISPYELNIVKTNPKVRKYFVPYPHTNILKTSFQLRV